MNKAGVQSPTFFYNKTPSDFFNEFIKGITYFENENPIEEDKLNYHRLKSCGSSRLKADEKFSSEESKQQVKKCYIERMIYDKLYEYYLHEQNTAHKHELRKMMNYYITYFPLEDIKIEIKYNDQREPYQLIINEKMKDKSIKHIYTKEWNSESVDCKLVIKMNNTKRYYSKINTFQRENPWIDVTNTSFGKKKVRNKLFIIEKEIRYLICKKHQHLNLGKK
jgi:hypothetical protein